MDESLRAKIIDQFKSTQLGFVRIRKNLGITHFSDAETEEYLRRIILATPIGAIERRGKNYYFTCAEFNAVLTVNAGSLTIITAKKNYQRLTGLRPLESSQKAGTPTLSTDYKP